MCTLLEDKEIDTECSSHNDYELRVIEYMSKMTKYLECKSVSEMKTDSSATVTPQSCPQVQVKLPKIDLPTFDGNVLCWQPYYQSIKVSVVDNSALAEVQKLEYLMRSLKGPAAEAVKGFAVVQENYQPVLEALKERFGHPRLILDAHIRSLIHLQRLNSDDALSMRKFYDQVVGHVRSVESMEQVVRAKESSQSPSLEFKVSAKKNTAKCVSQVNFKSSSPRRSSTSALCASMQVKQCCVCRKNHHVWSCVNFLSLAVKDRFRMALSKGLCFRCLEACHAAQSCEKPPCKHCRGKHHSLLHVDSVSSGSSATSPSSQTSPKRASLSQAPRSTAASHVVASSMVSSGGGKVILQTVPAVMCGSHGCSKVVQCFLDPGSQTSFVRQSIVQELGLDVKSVRIAVSGFGGKSDKETLRKRIAFTVAPVDKPGKPQCIEALTVPVICRPAEAVDIHPAKWLHLQDIVRGGSNEPVAVRTSLGLVFCGPTGGHGQECTVSVNIQIGIEEQLNETLQKFWNLESIGIKPTESPPSTNPSEAMVLKKFRDTLTYKDGRYEVSLPWKEDQVVLKDNYKQAENRLYNLEKKLLQEPAKARSYREAILKYIDDGVLEGVPCDQIAPTDGRPVFYLPHHAVIREDKQTTKTRVVFDATARDSNGLSLNSCLEAGPVFQPDLDGILLRFRKGHIGIMGDIKKMFLQVRLKDRDSHRYLWRDLDAEATPKIYRMTRVTFGVISSPFLAICTIQEHVKRCEETFPEASHEILRNPYVDDFASGRNGVSETLKLQQSTIELMQQAGFNLTEWSSNSSELMQTIPEKDRAPHGLIKLESDLREARSVTKALGLKWNTRADSLVFTMDVNSVRSGSEKQYTKREVASLAAKVFDSIGLITPFTVRSKLLLKGLWTQGGGWDDEIPVGTAAGISGPKSFQSLNTFTSEDLTLICP
ncbi:uncharacterized protein [Montipora capricornis]|uniref:uncharacterized protein n=1 Tax=Montipora capricornis TaxID=246305 RepID=UPI0035F1C200